MVSREVEEEMEDRVEETATTAAACTGCAQLHKDIRQDVSKMMSKIDEVCGRLEALISEKEKVLLEQMSESGSEEKYPPSPTESRASPSSVGKSNGGCRKRKPTKESVNRHLENGGSDSPFEKITRNISTPVSASSPFPDFQNFNGFVFDPMANPQNMMNLLNLVQQQQHQAAAHHHAQQQAREQKPVKAEESKQQEPSENRNQSPSASVEQTLLDQLSMQFNGKSPSPTVHASTAAAAGSSEDDTSANSSISKCSNCSTIKTTAWRRDLEGKLVCNACGLYYRLHRTHRPVHMRKDFIQQRFRRRMREDENPATSQAAVFSQLLGLPSMANGGANALTFLEQINQLNQSQEQRKSP